MEDGKTGVVQETLVHTCQGSCSAHALVTGDHVWSFDNEVHQWRVGSIRAMAVRSVKASMSYVRVSGRVLGLGCRQLVWAQPRLPQAPVFRGWNDEESVPGLCNWVPAQNLIPGDRVLSRSGYLVVEGNVLRHDMATCLAELETGDLHNFAVGPQGVLVHNRNPALAQGQVHQLIARGTGAQQTLTLPPINQDHIFAGLLEPGMRILHGFHHFTGAFTIQQGVPISVVAHTLMAANPPGGQVARTVNLRITPAHSATGDAPFAARVDVLDPATGALLGTKDPSTFFPLNWTRAQVIQAIYEAFANYVVATGLPPVGPGLQASTDTGVRLLLHVIAPAGTPTMIDSGYPHGPQPRVIAAQAPQ
jgi:hypothetical protein